MKYNPEELKVRPERREDFSVPSVQLRVLTELREERHRLVFERKGPTTKSRSPPSNCLRGMHSQCYKYTRYPNCYMLVESTEYYGVMSVGSKVWRAVNQSLKYTERPGVD